jgi:hypothetical protein
MAMIISNAHSAARIAMNRAYAAFEKIKSDITNNITDINKQKRNCLLNISEMRKLLNDHLDKIEKQTVEEMVAEEQHLQVELKKVLVAMETKRTDLDNIWQDVNKVKKYATDLQTFIGVNGITSVVDGEIKKQKGAFNHDLFELKLEFLSELLVAFSFSEYKFAIR